MISKPSDLPRLPAHAGLVPAPPMFGPAAVDLAGALAASVPGAGPIEQLSESGGTGGRFFRTTCGPSGAPLFLKLMSDSEHRALAEAEAMLAPIPAGAPVVRSCGVFEVADGSRRVVVAYPYLDARFLDADPRDMRRLGRSIASLHGLFRALPGGDAVKTRAFDRARRLDAVLADAKLLPSRGLAAEMEAPDAQVLHGDLNVGNILAEPETDAIRFLDFEDVRHSYGPPILDLALPIERFCLLLDRDREAITCAQALLSGYAEQSGVKPILRVGALARALDVINRRALALLIERRHAGLESPQSEWRKFTGLLERHAERAETIAAIEEAAR